MSRHGQAETSEVETHAWPECLRIVPWSLKVWRNDYAYVYFSFVRKWFNFSYTSFCFPCRAVCDFRVMLKRALPSREQDNQTTWCWQSEWKNGAYLDSIWGKRALCWPWVKGFSMSHEFRHADFYENIWERTSKWRHPYISFVRLQELNNIITESFVGGVNRSSTRCLFFTYKIPGCFECRGLDMSTRYGALRRPLRPGRPNKSQGDFLIPVSTGYQITWLRWRLYPLAAT